MLVPGKERSRRALFRNVLLVEPLTSKENTQLSRRVFGEIGYNSSNHRSCTILYGKPSCTQRITGYKMLSGSGKQFGNESLVELCGFVAALVLELSVEIEKSTQ